MRIAGGLGNQLFQYAMGRALSIRTGIPLVLDHLSGFPRDIFRRTFLLDRFQVQCDYVPATASFATLSGRLRRRARLLANRALPLDRRTYLLEPDSLRMYPEIAALRPGRTVYLEGYWQFEDYFRDVAPQIRKDVRLRVEHDPLNVEWASRIRDVNAVCLHVRRLRGVVQAHPLAESSPELRVDDSYYQRALQRIAERVEKPHFFVFADHPDWARDNIRSPFPLEFVTHNGAAKDYEDLWLMSQCRHFIIANSSFSWWGAWLGEHPGKVVVAPRNVVGLTSVPSEWESISGARTGRQVTRACRPGGDGAAHRRGG